MVSEGEWRHVSSGREQGAGERLPLGHDGLQTIHDEFGEPHLVL